MRSIFTFTIAVLIITACSQTSITATPTPQPSTTPTRISTVTPTFSPAFTSTPPVPDLTPEQQAWETHFAGTAHVNADGTLVDSVSGERIGSATDVWTPNDDGTYTRKYYPSNLVDEQGVKQELTVTYKPEDIVIVLDANGKPTGAWDLSGWVKNEAGVLEREMGVFPTKDGGTVEIEMYSKEEVKAEILQTAVTASPGERVAADEIWYTMADTLFGRENRPGVLPWFTYGGMDVIGYKSYAFGDNVLGVRDEKTGLLKPRGTAFYAVVAVREDGSDALVGWRAGGIGTTRVVDDARLDIPMNFDNWFIENDPKI